MATCKFSFYHLALLLAFSLNISKLCEKESDILVVSNSGKTPELCTDISTFRNISFGHETLYRTLISPIHISGGCSRGELRGKSKTVTSSRSVNGGSYMLSMCLLLCGDIHPCPGPVQKRTPKNPCGYCEKGVRSNSRAINCDVCEKWIHAKCCGISVTVYEQLLKEFPCTCDKCIMSQLPGTDSDLLDDEHVSNNQLPDDFQVPQDKLGFSKMKGLHFIHLNVRSLLPKLSELKVIANSTRAAVIGITESWLDSSVQDSEVEIPGYVIVRNDRRRDGGGVCLYIRNDLAFNPRSDVNKSDTESLWIEILLPKTRPILIGVCYRPPKDYKFFEKLENDLMNCDRLSDLECYILGDFNVNVMHNKNSGLTKCVSDVCDIFDLCQLISDPTRITDSSKSIIDLIFTSSYEKVSQSGVVDIGLSDHMMIFCTRKISKGQIGKHQTIQIRSMKNYTAEILNDELCNVDWSGVLNCDNVHDAWCNFKLEFTKVLDKICPVKHIRLKQRTEPWINSDVLEAIRDRDKALYLYRKNNDSADYVQYKQLRNRVQNLVRQAKRHYLSNKLDENKNNPRKLWDTLKGLGYSNKCSKSCSKINLEIDGNICFDNITVAEHFNKFYTSVASCLVEKLPSAPGMFTKASVDNYYARKGVQPNSFAFHTVEENYVLKLLKNTNCNKGTGLDNLPAKFVKDGARSIVKPILYIVNLSISSGEVPCDLKNARVVPLYKKNSRTEAGNFRPVSILPVISKILEKVIFDQLESYLKANNLTYQYQSGFRPSFSTDTCLIYLTDYIKKEMSLGRYTGMVLIDLQKAFDTVNHQILKNKLSSIGLCNSAISWFDSYLSERHQCVNVNGTSSSAMEISCGVPQGSLLGPLLFLIYVNDMECAVNCKLLLYADDSALLVSHKDVKVIEQTLSIELQSLSHWLVDNKLSLHLGKTEAILFGTKRKLRRCSRLNITCNGHKINSQTSVKYLGLELDQSLNGDVTGCSVIRKSASRLKFLYRQCNFLPTRLRKMLCMSLIQCHFDYSCSTWYSNSSQKIKDKLQTCQNKVMRFVLSMAPRTHIGIEQFKELGWLNVENRVSQLKLNHMYKIYNNMAPDYLTQNTVKSNTRAGISTRSSSYNFLVPFAKGANSNSFNKTGIDLWNSLPVTVKSSSTISCFKKITKSFLLDSMQLANDSEFIYY